MTIRLFLVVTLFSLSLSAIAGSVQLENVRIWAAPESTRVVFDVSGPVQHRLEMLTNPYRTVIDIQDTSASGTLSQPVSTDKYLHRIRSGVYQQDDLRVVLDLKKHVETKVFLLPPNQRYGHRLVIDIFDKDKKEDVQKAAIDREPGKPRDVVIAIDAGHGGEDPGARGPSGIHEKDVILKISKQLAELINKEHGMRAVLIREGDYFLRLRKRIDKARKHKADLFISVHADAFKDPRVSGSSV